MSQRCCVFQPFDKGPYDKRYDDTIAPAIAAAGLEAYRVDRDDGAVIPIDTLHEEIGAAAICLADIGDLNPNVMYELGYAIARDKDVVIICPAHASKLFPFDIRHRGIITYATDSASDFEKLKESISKKITALMDKRQLRDDVIESPVTTTEGLQPHEQTALALVMASSDSTSDIVTAYTVKQDMEKAGYTQLATRLALSSLTSLGKIESVRWQDINGDYMTGYRMTQDGEEWLQANQDKLQMRHPPKRPADPFALGSADKDVPF